MLVKCLEPGTRRSPISCSRRPRGCSPRRVAAAVTARRLASRGGRVDDGRVHALRRHGRAAARALAGRLRPLRRGARRPRRSTDDPVADWVGRRAGPTAGSPSTTGTSTASCSATGWSGSGSTIPPTRLAARGRSSRCSHRLRRAADAGRLVDRRRRARRPGRVVDRPRPHDDRADRLLRGARAGPDADLRGVACAAWPWRSATTPTRWRASLAVGPPRTRPARRQPSMRARPSAHAVSTRSRRSAAESLSRSAA